MPPTTAPSTDILAKLYSSGAYLPLGIVLVFLGVTWGSRHLSWLQVPNRAHYVSATIAGLAILVGPATQGTTPNVSMLLAAIGTVIALILPGAPSTVAATPTTLPTATALPPKSQTGFARLGVMIAIVIFGSSILAFGCATSSRNKALGASVATLDAAEVGLHAYCHQHTEDMIAADKAAGKTADVAAADLTAFRAKCDHAQADIDGGYHVTTAAGVANDAPSLAKVASVVQSIVAELAAIGVKL